MHLSAVLVLKLMATLVNWFIFDSSCLLPWTIHMPEDDRITVQGYYEMVVSKQPADVQDPLSNHILDEVRVGNTKNELDKVGNTSIGVSIFYVHARVYLAMSVIVDTFLIFLSLVVQFSALVAPFGRIEKFYVKKNESTTVLGSTNGRPDVFAILMGSSREQLARKTLPSRVTVRNKKDELHNAIIT